MKTMTCKEMGGDCDLKFRAATSAEMAKKMTAHVIKAHPAVAKKMRNMSEKDHEKWESKFHKNWDKAPDA
jgi:predicted small metal-binding protein